MQKQFYPSLFSSPNGNSTETFKPQYRWSLGLLLSFFHFFPPPPVPPKIRKEYKIGRILYSCLLLLSSVTSWGRGHTIKWDWLARAVFTGRDAIFSVHSMGWESLKEGDPELNPPGWAHWGMSLPCRRLPRDVFSWAMLLLWLKHRFVPEHLCLQLGSQVLQVAAQAFGLI